MECAKEKERENTFNQSYWHEKVDLICTYINNTETEAALFPSFLSGIDCVIVNKANVHVFLWTVVIKLTIKSSLEENKFFFYGLLIYSLRLMFS